LLLTGEYTSVPRKSLDLKEPPPKSSATPDIRYDSVVDDMNAPKEWVIFSDNKNYPEYLIIFEK
jgi:hypothetical protein